MGGRGPGEGGLKVRLFSVGKDRSGLFEPAVLEYARRLKHYTHFELVELSPSSRRKASREASAKEEGEAILGALRPGEALVALDERGKLLDSRAFADQVLRRAQNSSRDLAFVIGGDEGLSDEVKAAAHHTLSLSPLTMPHRLARAVLAEQLYRGFTLLKGEPYHK